MLCCVDVDVDLVGYIVLLCWCYEICVEVIFWLLLYDVMTC